MRPSSNATTQLYGLPSGKKGIIKTLELMSEIVEKYKTNIAIRELAQKIVSNIKNKDYFNEAKFLQNWVRDNIRYTRDVQGVETIATPDHTLYTRHGDCDDHSIVLATLLQSIGHRTRFVAVGLLPNIYSHVYVEVLIKGKWLPVETTENWKIGQQPPMVKARLVLGDKKNKSIGTMQEYKFMRNFENAESELDAELEALVTANVLDQAGYTLDQYMDGLAGMGEMSGFFKRLKKKIKKKTQKIRRVVRKVVKVAAVAAAVYFTGGAALALIAKAKAQKEAAKAEADRADEENRIIEAENVLIMAEEAEYEKSLLIQSKAEKDAVAMLKKQGIKLNSPQAKAYLSKAINLESDKLASGVPVGEPSVMKKLLPVAAIGIPLAIAALG